MLTDEYDNHHNNFISRNDKVKKVIELCLSSNNKYDHVLITRFDLDFKKKFSECNFDFNSFNIISQTGKKTICDNFYFMPFNLLTSIGITGCLPTVQEVLLTGFLYSATNPLSIVLLESICCLGKPKYT